MGFDVTNITRSADIADSVITEFDTEFLLGFTDERPLNFLATFARQLSGGTWSIPLYDPLAVDTSSVKLTDGVDPDAERLSDRKVTFTPEELGKVVAYTEFASLTTNGMIDRVAPRLVGIHAGQTVTRLVCDALDTADAGHTLRPEGVASQAATAASNIMDTALLRSAYNRIASANAPVVPSAGRYVLVVHQDVADDIKKDTSAGGFVDVVKYANPEMVLANEIGMIAGFRVVVNNQTTIVADGGASNVDVYKSYVVGGNGLGLAQRQPVQMRAAPPVDALGRFVRLSWYAVLQYKLVQPDSVWVIETASSFGNNA